MLRGLYTATSAMNTNNRRLDVITNNIANANTTGYKKDLVISETFPEMLIKKINSPDKISNLDFFKGVQVTQDNDIYQVETTGGFLRTKTIVGTGFSKAINFAVNKDGYLSTYDRDEQGNIDTSQGNLILGNRGPVFVGEGQLEINDRGQVLVDGNIVDNLVMATPLNTIGTINAGIRLDKIQVNFAQGQLHATGNDLDLALRGEGFYQVETPQGLRFTRDGSFKLNANSELVTSEGYRVLGMEGPIVIEGGSVTVTESGAIYGDEEWMGQLNMVNILNSKDLRKDGNNLYRMEENIAPQVAQFEGKVVQGFLEGSNVETIKEMVEMVTLFRNYESNQRIIKAYDDTLQKSVNEIGKV